MAPSELLSNGIPALGGDAGQVGLGCPNHGNLPPPTIKTPAIAPEGAVKYARKGK